MSERLPCQINGTGPSEYKTVFSTPPSECDKGDSIYCPSEVYMICCNDDDHCNLWLYNLMAVNGLNIRVNQYNFLMRKL